MAVDVVVVEEVVDTGLFFELLFFLFRRNIFDLEAAFDEAAPKEDSSPPSVLKWARVSNAVGLLFVGVLDDVDEASIGRAEEGVVKPSSSISRGV